MSHMFATRWELYAIVFWGSFQWQKNKMKCWTKSKKLIFCELFKNQWISGIYHGPWAKNQKKIAIPAARAATPSIMPQQLSAALLSEVAGVNSSPQMRMFWKKATLFDGGWLCWTSLWNFRRTIFSYFFNSLYQKSAGKGHHIRWAPGNGRDVGRVGQFTPSDALAKSPASAYDMCVYRLRLMSVSRSQDIYVK